MDAYIRAAATANWMDSDGNIYAANVGWTVAGTNWTQGNDGFYYYQNRVTPGDETSVLAVTPSSSATDVPSEYSLKWVIVAEALQADGIADSAVEAWSNAPGIG